MIKIKCFYTTNYLSLVIRWTIFLYVSCNAHFSVFTVLIIFSLNPVHIVVLQRVKRELNLHVVYTSILITHNDYRVHWFYIFRVYDIGATVSRRPLYRDGDVFIRSSILHAVVLCAPKRDRKRNKCTILLFFMHSYHDINTNSHCRVTPSSVHI